MAPKLSSAPSANPRYSNQPGDIRVLYSISVSHIYLKHLVTIVAFILIYGHVSFAALKSRDYNEFVRAGCPG